LGPFRQDILQYRGETNRVGKVADALELADVGMEVVEFFLRADI
jgi:hypothetical protein